MVPVSVLCLNWVECPIEFQYLQPVEGHLGKVL